MIAARKKPLPILALYALEAIVAWMIAAPWAETIARTIGAHPDGDRALFWDAGMPLLVDLQHRLGGVLAGLFASSAIALSVYAVLSVLVSGALLSALLGDPLPRAIGRGAESFFRLFVIGAIALFAAGVLFVVVGALPAYFVANRASHPRAGLLLSLIPLLLALLGVLIVMAIADLARARVVARDSAAIDALLTAARDRRAVIAQALDTLPRTLASLGLLGFAAALTTAASSVLLIFIVHQLAALLRVALRASVLARALRHAGEA